MNGSTQHQAGSKAPAIEARALLRRFGGRVAVSGLDLSVPAGSTFGFIGLNGAGKSTTIRMLTGLLAPHSGQALLGGIDVWKDRVSAVAKLGYVPDRPNAYPWMRVEQAIDFASSLWPTWDGVTASRLRAKYRLDPRQRVGKLSKGEGAKLSLLLALAHDPSILILDEPTDGLDVIARDDFLEEVLESIVPEDRTRTVFISSHSLLDLQRLTDTIAILHEGTIILEGKTDELISTTKRVRLVLEQPSSPAPAAPPGTLLVRRAGRELTFTVRPFTDATLGQLRTAPGVLDCSVSDLSLDDLFKDVIKGRGQNPGDERQPSPPATHQHKEAAA